MGFGEALGEARKLAGYSQQHVADALGLNRVMVTYWENNTRRPSMHQAEVLAYVLRPYGHFLPGYLAALSRYHEEEK